MIQKHVRDKEWKNGHWPGLLRAEKSPILWYFLLLGTRLTPTFSCGIISAHRCCLNRLANKKLSESNSPINGNIYKLCQTVSTSSEKQFQNSFLQHGYDLTHVLRPEEARAAVGKAQDSNPLTQVTRHLSAAKLRVLASRSVLVLSQCCSPASFTWGRCLWLPASGSEALCHLSFVPITDAILLVSSQVTFWVCSVSHHLLLNCPCQSWSFLGYDNGLAYPPAVCIHSSPFSSIF